MAFYLWRRSAALAMLESPALIAKLQRVVRPNAVFVFALGLALAWTGVFPIVFPAFAAPPEEPISGLLANYPLIESTGFALLFWLIAIGCLVFPWAVQSLNAALLRIVAFAWTLPGVGLVLFVAMNFFTHGGLTYNTR